MAFKIIPYRQGSAGAHQLAMSLRGSVLLLEGGRYLRRWPNGRRGDTIINWGNVNPPLREGVLNGNGIQTASNKLHFFQRVHDRGEAELIPDFWTDRAAIPDDAFPIVCRTVLAGHSGEGIVIANTPAELVPAPLYVRYIKKKSEFRIHVGRRNIGGGVLLNPLENVQIIAEQRKTRRADHENPNWMVRNHANGFIYQRNDIVVPDCVRDAARRALAYTELDFGAVDVIYNEKDRRAYVIEINTAPGLEGQTVTDYANFFRSLV